MGSKFFILEVSSLNILEFPSHICASGEDTEIINLIKDFFEETMCLYNTFEALVDSLKDELEFEVAQVLFN